MTWCSTSTPKKDCPGVKKMASDRVVSEMRKSILWWYLIAIYSIKRHINILSPFLLTAYYMCNFWKMNCHQILSGACNAGDHCFAVGSVEGVPFTVCLKNNIHYLSYFNISMYLYIISVQKYLDCVSKKCLCLPASWFDLTVLL